MARQVRVEGADELRVRDVVRPVDVQGPGRAAKAADRAVGGGGQRAQDAGAVREHQVGRRHPGEQGDLRVPGVGGKRGAVAEFVRPVLLDDLLLGDVEGDPAALHLQTLAQRPDLLEEGERFLRRAVVDRLLYVRVVELGAAADEGPAYVDALRAAVRVQVDRPEHGRAGLVGQEARGAFGEPGRMEGDLLVREVEGRHAAVRLGVQGAAGGDEGGDVGDRVPDAVAAAVLAAGQVHRLVEVGGRRRVDGEEGDVRRVVGRQAGWPGGLLQYAGREALGHTETGPQGGQGGLQRSPRYAGGADVAARHGSSVGRVPVGGTPSVWTSGRRPSTFGVRATPRASGLTGGAPSAFGVREDPLGWRRAIPTVRRTPPCSCCCRLPRARHPPAGEPR